jgi:hypothetical protein
VRRGAAPSIYRQEKGGGAAEPSTRSSCGRRQWQLSGSVWPELRRWWPTPAAATLWEMTRRAVRPRGEVQARAEHAELVLCLQWWFDSCGRGWTVGIRGGVMVSLRPSCWTEVVG